MFGRVLKFLRQNFLKALVTTSVVAATASSAIADERPLLSYASTIEVAAPPQKVWNSFKDFDRIHDWHPVTENTVLLVGEKNKALAVREFQLKGGGFVISELLNFNEQQRWFSYRILKTNLPLNNYLGEMWVEPGKNGGSIVHWVAHFQRPMNGGADTNDAATTELVKGVFKAGLDNIVVINR